MVQRFAHQIGEPGRACKVAPKVCVPLLMSWGIFLCVEKKSQTYEQLRLGVFFFDEIFTFPQRHVCVPPDALSTTHRWLNYSTHITHRLDLTRFAAPIVAVKVWTTLEWSHFLLLMVLSECVVRLKVKPTRPAAFSYSIFTKGVTTQRLSSKSASKMYALHKFMATMFSKHRWPPLAIVTPFVVLTGHESVNGCVPRGSSYFCKNRKATAQREMFNFLILGSTFHRVKERKHTIMLG